MGEEGLGLDGCECVWMRKPERVLFIETLERERGREKREGGRVATGGAKGFSFWFFKDNIPMLRSICLLI